MTSTEADAADWLLTPEAIRHQCATLYEVGREGRLQHFALRMERLAGAADAVCETIRANYPSLQIPPHARWRHFVVDGVDRWARLAGDLGCDARERARIECELAITSVLLDAGAGPAWRYQDAVTGRMLSRSEGLAIASLDLYTAGGFSSRPNVPLRADAQGLAGFSTAALERAFQVSADNPLAGADGRAALMQRLGQAVSRKPEVFGADDPRLGNIADYLAGQARDGRIEARTILLALLQALGDIWPGRITLAHRNLGDTWQHPAVGGDGKTRGLVPFHKLSQWLAYSLFEPLQRLGLTIDASDALTGLAEYRNGGLFIDAGVIVLREPAVSTLAHEPGSELVVEWRALTICLIDALAPLVRDRLGVDDRQLPLASILEGGTWATGRRLAGQLRAEGSPPITIISDGSVF